MNAAAARRALALVAAAPCAMLAAGPAAAQVGDPDPPVVTLAEARDRAALVEPASVAARSRLDAAGWERRTALAGLFTPEVSADATYLRFSDPFFNFGTGDVSASATSATLTARYSLIGAGKLAALRRSRAELASSRASATATEYETAYATDALYFGVLADRELSRVAADRLARAEEQLALARARVLAGGVIASDSLQLLLEANRARLGVLSRDSALQVSRLRLGRQVGAAGPVDAAPVDTSTAGALPFSLEAATAEMLAGGPLVLDARAAEARASAELSAERDGYLPDLLLEASAGAYDSQFFPSAFRRTQLGVTVSLPVWDGGRRELAIARARARRDHARAVRADVERAAAEQMAEVYRGYETARARVALEHVAVRAAGENYRVQLARYREGATTILDLLEAQVALTEAEAAIVQARYATRLAAARMESLLGRRIFEPEQPAPAGGRRGR